MGVIGEKGKYGSASIKNNKGNFGKGGCIRFDIKSDNEAIIKVENTDKEAVGYVGRTDGGETDFTTYKYDIDLEEMPYVFDRINIQDATGSGEPIYIRYLIYSNAACEDFVDPIDTSYAPPVTTRKSVRASYTVIFKNVYSMPSGYDNWGWGCDISYSGGAMVIKPQKGEYGAVSLKRNTVFRGGSLRFDLKNEGKVNVQVEYSKTEENLTIATINPSDTFETYIIDANLDEFDRITFQDATGSGDTIWVKNLVYSTGYADEFDDPI